MVRNSKFLFSLIILTLVASCATGVRELKKNLRTQVRAGQYESALKTLDSSKVLRDSEESQLLYLMEKGAILHSMGHYGQSIQVFEKAKKLATDQYTVRISKKLKTYIGSDSSDIFYGEKYELSMLYFYQTLNHFILSYSEKIDELKVVEAKEQIVWNNHSGKSQREELYRARAELLAWDSFLNDLKNERSGTAVFKDDLIAKVLGGQIHEAVGTSKDREIAYQLYKDALKLLLKNYNGYKSFNLKSKEFVSDFDKLPSLGMKKVKQDYISKTKHQKELQFFLKTKVLTLAKKLRSRSWKRDIRPFDIDLKKIKSKRESNVSIVLQEGIIPSKIGEKQYYGLGKYLDKGGASAAIISLFAADVLGLYPPPNTYNPAGAYLGYNVAKLAVTEAAIKFELPKIEANTINNHLVLEIWSNEAKVKEVIVPVVSPLGDVAEQAIVEQSAWLYPKIGTRLATKHAVAIAAAFGTYSALKRQSGAFLAKNAAVIQYVASSKGIELSESADTRQWSTIPATLRIVDLFLKPGTYQLKIRSVGPKTKTQQLGQLMISDGKKKHFFQKRLHF
ncbi:hypothetical protein A9Q84_09185 [Halobacteriovorax marinus]|uniref:Lipoprotein n=1 Tax=Halobacteriovorax marinus TaxID=97084 RepID=A0A1Y5FD20_9BACT|nr:hypothetical protein A9Q84_09185 [Halobacteriovorax marinus]